MRWFEDLVLFGIVNNILLVFAFTHHRTVLTSLAKLESVTQPGSTITVLGCGTARPGQGDKYLATTA